VTTRTLPNRATWLWLRLALIRCARCALGLALWWKARALMQVVDLTAQSTPSGLLWFMTTLAVFPLGIAVAGFWGGRDHPRVYPLLGIVTFVATYIAAEWTVSIPIEGQPFAILYQCVAPARTQHSSDAVVAPITDKTIAVVRASGAAGRYAAGHGQIGVAYSIAAARRARDWPSLEARTVAYLCRHPDLARAVTVGEDDP
jgi:hypothetical protein